MLTSVLHYFIVALSLMNAGYMLVDGMRAFIKGDYIRQKSGEYAGQLGPWTKLVSAVGIDPMSPFMKSVFVFFGVAGLCITTAYILQFSWAWNALLIFNICCLWNLFFGTASCILQIILLLLEKYI